MIQKNMDVV